MTAVANEVLERIIDEHLVGGRVVTEYVFAEHTLAPPLPINRNSR